MGHSADESAYELLSSEDDTSKPLLPQAAGARSAPQRRLGDVSCKDWLNRLGYLSSSRRNARLLGLLQSVGMVCLGLFIAAAVFFFADYRPSNFRHVETDEVSSLVKLPLIGPPTLSFRGVYARVFMEAIYQSVS